jgi:hypothetical protein
MNENEHISKEEFLAFQCDMMKAPDKEKFLEHICSCDYCADQFSALVSEETIAAPRDMKANILRAARRPEVQLAIKVRETSKHVQLLIYSLKVCTATVCALLLLLFSVNISTITNPQNTSDNNFTNTMAHEDDSESLTTALRNGIDTISKRMLDFSNTIMKTEVTDNDQKEK